ncbi:MAG: tyrosine-type recombinase/integrase [Candidatus Sulfotelmatobacter sp.]
MKSCHPHMLRDTFAVEMLLAGVPLEQVSILLGHKSVKITEKHYAPWVKARQERLPDFRGEGWRLRAKAGCSRMRFSSEGRRTGKPQRPRLRSRFRGPVWW